MIRRLLHLLQRANARTDLESVRAFARYRSTLRTMIEG